MLALVNGGTFDSATGGTFQSDTGGTFHSDIPGTFESDMGGTFKVLQSSSVEILLARGARTILWGVKTKEVYSNENELSTSGPLRISLIEMPDQVGHDV